MDLFSRAEARLAEVSAELVSWESLLIRAGGPLASAAAGRVLAARISLDAAGAAVASARVAVNLEKESERGPSDA